MSLIDLHDASTSGRRRAAALVRGGGGGVAVSREYRTSKPPERSPRTMSEPIDPFDGPPHLFRGRTRLRRIGAARRPGTDRVPVVDQPATTSGAQTADNEEQSPSTPSR